MGSQSSSYSDGLTGTHTHTHAVYTNDHVVNLFYLIWSLTLIFDLWYWAHLNLTYIRIYVHTHTHRLACPSLCLRDDVISDSIFGSVTFYIQVTEFERRLPSSLSLCVYVCVCRSFTTGHGALTPACHVTVTLSAPSRAHVIQNPVSVSVDPVWLGDSATHVTTRLQRSQTLAVKVRTKESSASPLTHSFTHLSLCSSTHHHISIR